MRKLGWFGFQIAVVGFFVWVDWGVSHSGDPRAIPGLATAIGVFIAFFCTLLAGEVIDSFIGRRSISRPPPLNGDIPQAIDHRGKLSAPARQRGEPPETFRRLR